MFQTDDIRKYLIDNFGLTGEQAQRLLKELPALFSPTAEEYIRQRHLELQNKGLKNDQIYRQLKQELDGRVFSAGDFSIRQIRRIIYG